MGFIICLFVIIILPKLVFRAHSRPAAILATVFVIIWSMFIPGSNGMWLMGTIPFFWAIYGLLRLIYGGIDVMIINRMMQAKTAHSHTP